MLKIEFSEADVKAPRYERYHHPHPRVQPKMKAVYLKSQGQLSLPGKRVNGASHKPGRPFPAPSTRLGQAGAGCNQGDDGHRTLTNAGAGVSHMSSSSNQFREMVCWSFTAPTTKTNPFVVYDLPKEHNVAWQYKPYPWVSAVAGTNYCFIGLDVDDAHQRIVIFSVLDSMGKGGAQVGIENISGFRMIPLSVTRRPGQPGRY